jgi:hypothetical protein
MQIVGWQTVSDSESLFCDIAIMQLWNGGANGGDADYALTSGNIHRQTSATRPLDLRVESLTKQPRNHQTPCGISAQSQSRLQSRSACNLSSFSLRTIRILVSHLVEELQEQHLIDQY